MKKYFNEICEYRKESPAIRGKSLSTADYSLKQIKISLQNLHNELESRFSRFKDIDLTINHSKGSGIFPAILHVSILPPDQKVSNGVYVVICFDKAGKGALVGCAESKTNPKGLQTIHKDDIGSKLDVNGFSESTKYNHCFYNPKEFLYPLNDTSEQEMIKHIEKSLDFNLHYLNLIIDNNYSVKDQIDLIRSDNSLSDTEKEALIKARRGQGIFRKKALQKYKHCCITNLSIKKLLIASHIKPWKISTNQERLDENNCLLLCPNYDKLFDQGYITFINGELVTSPKLSADNIKALKLDVGFKLSGLTDETKEYLLYHNRYIFLKK